MSGSGGAGIVWSDGSVVALALISVVITLMLFPFAGWRRYHEYRPPLFVGGVVLMPLFVAIAVTLRSGWTTDARAAGLAALLAGFWASAAWLASPRTQGSFVPGLEFGPGLQFRPDLILPGGILYVKGTILTGLGMMLMFQEAWRLPAWNWWGFVMAFFGIITLIPLRGMLKMLARRARFLGRDPRWQAPARWASLVAGLAILAYGFLSAFMGRTPLVDFRPLASHAWQGAGLIAVAAAGLAAREAWKRRLPEGPTTTAQRLGKQVWLYLATVAYLYGFVLLFMGRVMRPQPLANPEGTVLGATLVALGAVLVVGLRPVALRNELHGMIRVMVGSLAALPAEERQQTMQARMATISAYPLAQRVWHVGQMLEATGRLDEVSRAALDAARDEVLLSLDSGRRRAMMQAMDRLSAV